MKQIFYYILSVALIFAVSYLIVDNLPPELLFPAEFAAAPTPSKAPEAPSAGSDAPASPSDLYCPEPLSDGARAALEALTARMQAENALCAVAYLGPAPAEPALAGYLEQAELLTALAEKRDAYAFLPELTPAQCGAGGGALLYCLVPRSEGAVRITAGEREIYRSERGGPALFTADAAGFRVSLTADGETKELAVEARKNGAPVPQPGLLDFTA